jgi:2-oxoglutarate dehydrogenase E2 component (dihydrolipoamide succinyltransferase)
MSTEVVMPQMGESIAEGTVSKWLKKVGDKVEKDEPILEISTDKVDAEVPAPASGVILEIKVKEGETVPVGTVVAVIGEASQAVQTSTPPPEKEQATSQTITTMKDSSEVVESASVTLETVAPSQTATTVNEVVMPQMGESIAEGTVSKWLKKVGDKVEKDEPILEISTDKVDAEVPAPASGVILEIKVKEGETVPVGTVVAVIGKEASAISDLLSQTTESQTQESTPRPAQAQTQIVKEVSAAAQISEKSIATTQENGKQLTLEELRRKKSSPLVRSIAKKHGIDISKIQGTGISGRVTKKDILAYIESGAAFKPQDLMKSTETPTTTASPVSEIKPQPASQTTKAEYTPPVITALVGDRV